jgi:hypothetical protein
MAKYFFLAVTSIALASLIATLVLVAFRQEAALVGGLFRFWRCSRLLKPTAPIVMMREWPIFQGAAK